MSTVGNQTSTRPALFPVEWPLKQISAGNMRQMAAHRDATRTPRIKRRKIEHRYQDKNLARAQTTEHQVQTNRRSSELDTRGLYLTRGTSISDVKNEPALPSADPNIFNSLDHDEASWLVEEVNEANRSIFGAEKTAEKLKQDEEELARKKSSLGALKSLLNDLRRNIKYPDEDTAKDLDMLDEVSANFGVRNMVNCLGLLDNYFSELQKQLDK